MLAYRTQKHNFLFMVLIKRRDNDWSVYSRETAVAVSHRRTRARPHTHTWMIVTIPCFWCLLFSIFGDFFLFIIGRKNRLSFFLFTARLYSAFIGASPQWYRIFQCFLLATPINSIFVRLLLTWLGAKICEITCVIIIFAERLFEGFDIYWFRDYLVWGYFPGIIGKYRKDRTLTIIEG